METNVLKAQRKGLRAAFTLSLKKIETELSKEESDLKALSILRIQITDKFQRLDVCQNAISEKLLQGEDGERLFNDDLDFAENYRDKYLELCALIDSRVQDFALPCDKETRKFKLPKIELKRFSGEAKDYLTFWSQFQKIHNDRGIADEDKMHYLLQSMEPGLKAERLVLSFPATAANYSKAIEQLKERFGREDLLVQIYVRDMLTLVMKNAATGRAKTDLPTIYDDLEGKLRALESLGRTQEKYGDFLAPLVESCLPEEVLVAWERSRNHDSTEKKGTRNLEHLMNFLRQEVKGEEMVLLARTGFGPPQMSHRKKDPHTEQVKFADPTTASALVSLENPGKVTSNCIFCDRNHPSQKCFSAKKMTLADKKQLLVKKGACFSCLKKAGHLSKFCNVKNQLNCACCNGNHFDIMCYKQEKRNDPRNVSLSNSSRNETVFLQTLRVRVRFRGQEKVVRCVIDSASQSSYVSENVITQLNLSPLRKELVIHQLFGGNESQPKHHEVFSLEVSSLKRSFAFNFEALSERNICGFIPQIEDKKILNELREKEIDFCDSFRKEVEIGLLIGADVMGQILTGNFVQLECGLSAIETKLGWTVVGKQLSCGKDNILTTLSMHAMKIPLNSLWELELLGISHPDQTDRGKGDINLDDFNDKIKILSDGRYEVELPWKHDSGNLPDNRELTLIRHEKMVRRTKCNGYFSNYQEVFKEWENLKIIERVPEAELVTNKCHYLAHRPVIKLQSQTTKYRPCFDGSAREKGKLSLNNCFFKGINLLELIPDILDRFRSYPIGISADIEKAFLMLSVAPKDRDYLRFFYPSEEEQLIYRHRRVVFGVSSSPFLLNASIMHLLDNCPPQYSEVAQKLKRSFYVDNCVSGVFNNYEQERFIEHSKLIMSNGCFNLRGFESNVAGKNVDCHTGDTSVLGVIWNLDSDTLRCCVDLDALTCDAKIRKRQILSIVQKIFDPIGLLTPATLLPKLLLQDLWKLKISWDVELSQYDVNRFVNWFKDIYVLRNVTVPRFMVINSSSELHVFVDASKGAYAACVFVRSIVDSEVKINLIRAKSRVAPLKPLSIPRLELMACCVGSRLANSSLGALDLSDLKITFWSDSTTALWWIKEQGSWSVFVDNRVKEIRSLSRGQCWRHVPGDMNIADLLSRGCSGQKMLLSRWWEGPLWLRENPENWPSGETPCHSEEIERKKTKLVNIDLTKDAPPWHLSNVSNYEKMIRVFAYVFRFINRCRKSGERCENITLSFSEIENSEKRLIRLVQKCYFSNVKDLKNIDVYRDSEDIIRVKTKITNRKDDRSFLAPILLPGKCVFTRLLIRSTHEQNCHAGTQILMGILREKYWIIKFRRVVHNVIYKCMQCKRYSVKPFDCEPCPLPGDRVSDTVAFEIVGIDLAGPLFLKDGKKVWITLFTCAVYRAIHLELVASLSTDSFLLAVRRFIARRGRPKTIYSDNGTNLRGAYNELSKLDWDKILKESNTQRILWKFNPPSAPWWGGFWERLVRVIKELLRRTLGKSILNFEELLTVLVTCESVINSRPLTYITENSKDLIPLVPSMFLMENHSADTGDIDAMERNNMKKRIRYRAKLLDDLKNRFRREYLGQLIQKKNDSKICREPKVGEVVLIGDDNKKRLNWALAIITELIKGRDGKVRTIKVKTQSGVFLRPVQRIYPLEVTNDDVCYEKVYDAASSCLDKDNVIEDIVTESEPQANFTRSGRLVRPPQRLQLVNNICYMFETLPEPQGGEDVAK